MNFFSSWSSETYKIFLQRREQNELQISMANYSYHVLGLILNEVPDDYDLF